MKFDKLKQSNQLVFGCRLIIIKKSPEIIKLFGDDTITIALQIGIGKTIIDFRQSLR